MSKFLQFVITITLAFIGLSLNAQTIPAGNRDAEIITSIYDIQYSADTTASPYVDQTVTTKGIVTAVKWSDQYSNGSFVIQDGITPYSGIYVFRSATQVALGDSVTVTGKVTEYKGLTEMGTSQELATVTIINSDNAVPAPIEVTTLAANNEGYESMLVKVSDATYDGTALNDGTGALAPYTTYYNYSFVNSNVYNVIGIMSCFNNAQICPRGADDVEVVSGGDDDDDDDESITSIYEIQYTSDATGNSPYVDQTVTTKGIVTAVKWSDQYSNGSFVIQDGITPYSGIYVFRSATQVALGDSVTVTGKVTEYKGLTEIGTSQELATVTIINSDNAVPAPIEVTTLAANNEGYESMLVKVSDATYDGTALNDGTGALAPYKTFYEYTFENSTVYNVIGIMSCFNNAQICPRSAGDVEVVSGGDDDDDSITSIYEIQYTSDATGNSPYVNQIVTTKGIVTAVKWSDQYSNGSFVIQDGITPYSGIYVYRSATQVALGDSVIVTGKVTEYKGLTEMGTSQELATTTIINSGNAVPAPIEVTTLAANNEGYESMLVKVSDATFNGTALNDGTGDLVAYATYYSFSLISGSVYDVIGVISSFDIAQICPRSADDIELISGGEIELTSIYDIQYTEDASGESPMMGQSIVTKGVVTAASWSDQYSNGNFTIQDGTSQFNGLYVYRCATQVAIGDSVTVTGNITEYNGLTEVAQGATVTIINSDNTVPEPIEVTTSVAAGEGYESMLVKVVDVEASVVEEEKTTTVTVDDGSGALAIHTTFYTYEFVDGTHYNIVGVMGYYNAAQLCPRGEGDISLADAIDDNPFAAFSAYPNPFKNEIRFNGAQVSRVTVTSIIGKTMIDMPVTGASINTSELPSGIYLVRFIDDKGSATVVKMIK